MERKIIVIDDELDFLDSLKRGLKGAGFRNVHFENDSVAASKIIESEEPPFDIALIDITMPNISGIQLLELIKSVSPLTECIMITALNDAKTAISCLKKGAYDYLVKPVTRDDLVATINRALERLKFIKLLEVNKNEQIEKNHLSPVFEPIITQSLDVLRVLKEAELHAQSDIPVLITGESGTGKDLLAKAIHQVSHRAQQTYMPVNMAAINSGLFEAEFLGHTKGAFTGANKAKKGYFEAADGGTLFLDEIGETSPALQVRLLRAIQEGEIRRVGEDRDRRVDVRVIAATHRHLKEETQAGRFREDLYYRLSVFPIHLPPLRERREDIPDLALHFLEQRQQRQANSPGGFTAATMDAFCRYDWPGNIRELQNEVERGALLAGGEERIDALHLSEQIADSTPGAGLPRSGKMKEVIAQVEREMIAQALQQHGGNRTRAAADLGVSRWGLVQKIKGYGIEA